MEEKLKIIKNNLIEEVKKEQIELISLDINSEDYKKCLESINSKIRELDLIESILNNRISIEEIKNKSKKYLFLNEISNENVKKLLNQIEKYEKNINFFNDYEVKIDFSKELNEVKKDAIFNNIKIENIDTEKELLNLYSFVESKKEKFDISSTEFKKRIRIIEKDSYNELFINQKNKKLTRIEVLKDLKNIDNEKNIQKILELYKEKKSLKSRLIKPNSIEERIEQINKKIFLLETQILKNVNSYLEFNYDLCKYKLNLNINDNSYDNLVTFIFDIYDEIIKTREKFNTLLNIIKKERLIVATREKQIELQKETLKKNLSILTKNENINIEDFLHLTHDKINNIISQITLLKEITKDYGLNDNTLIKK